MKKQMAAVLICMVTMFIAGTLSALADGNTLEIFNETPGPWQVSADILVPPKLGVAGESQGTSGYVDYKTVTVQGGSSGAPASATISLNNGGQVQSVSVSSDQGRSCSISDIHMLGTACTLYITTQGIVLKDSFGSEAGKCLF